MAQIELKQELKKLRIAATKYHAVLYFEKIRKSLVSIEERKLL
jgi:hypothetical protein